MINAIPNVHTHASRRTASKVSTTFFWSCLGFGVNSKVFSAIANAFPPRRIHDRNSQFYLDAVPVGRTIRRQEKTMNQQRAWEGLDVTVSPIFPLLVMVWDSKGIGKRRKSRVFGEKQG